MNIKSQMAVATVMALGLMSAGAMAADPTGANSGKITFSGEVVDTPCNLAPGQDGTDVKVDFGQLSMSQLNKGVKTTEPFSLQLENCDLTGITGTSITFNSMDVDTTTQTLLKARGSAVGLGIGIDGYTFGTAKNLNGLISGNNELRFTAVAQKLADATPVTAGSFDATTSFVITYK